MFDVLVYYSAFPDFGSFERLVLPSLVVSWLSHTVVAGFVIM